MSSFESQFHDLGVYIDSEVRRCPHVRLYVEPCRAVSQHSDCLVIYVVKSATTAFVLSWSRSSTRGSIIATWFFGLPVCLQRRLQSVLNAAAWLVFRLRRYDHVSDALAILHWLRLPERVNFKLALMAYRVLNGIRHRMWTNLFLYLACQVVAVCGRRSRCSCASRRTVCQQLAVARLLSQPLFSGTLCQMMCSLHCLFQTDSCFTSHFLTL